MLTKQETLIAEVELDSYNLRCEGILGEDKWEFIMSFKDGFTPYKTWTCTDYCLDNEDVETMLWNEVLRLTQKYSVIVFDKGITEVEEEEYDY